MRYLKWEIIIGAFLLVMTLILVWVHIVIFQDARTLWFYLMEDLVFLPFQVLLVTLVLQGLMDLREKRMKLEKLNMVIEVFFSEVGTELLHRLAEFALPENDCRMKYIKINEWSERDFRQSRRQLKLNRLRIQCGSKDLEKLREFLLQKRDFMLRLLENPNLLEHETFTDLLWAVFHLTEEMAHRNNCSELSHNDRKHFATDIERAYVMLIYEWLSYMRHLQKDYPYLFSLALRMNPFNPEARAEIMDVDEEPTNERELPGDRDNSY